MNDIFEVEKLREGLIKAALQAEALRAQLAKAEAENMRLEADKIALLDERAWLLNNLYSSELKKYEAKFGKQPAAPSEAPSFMLGDTVVMKHGIGKGNIHKVVGFGTFYDGRPALYLEGLAYCPVDFSQVSLHVKAPASEVTLSEAIIEWLAKRWDTEMDCATQDAMYPYPKSMEITRTFVGSVPYFHPAKHFNTPANRAAILTRRRELGLGE